MDKKTVSKLAAIVLFLSGSGCSLFSPYHRELGKYEINQEYLKKRIINAYKDQNKISNFSEFVKLVDKFDDKEDCYLCHRGLSEAMRKCSYNDKP